MDAEVDAAAGTWKALLKPTAAGGSYSVRAESVLSPPQPASLPMHIARDLPQYNKLCIDMTYPVLIRGLFQLPFGISRECPLPTAQR